MSFSDYVPFTMSRLMPPQAVELKLPNYYFNREGVTSFVLSNHDTCKRIEIGSACFGMARRFELNELSQLESVVIEM